VALGPTSSPGGWVEHGHEVHVVAGDQTVERTGGKQRITTEAGITVHWLPVTYSNSMIYRQRILSFGRFVCGAAHVAASLAQGLILASSTPLTVAISGAYAALRHRVPMVMEVRDLWPEVPLPCGLFIHPLPGGPPGDLEHGRRTVDRLTSTPIRRSGS
jgi:hypothetical protein